jgi:hypothetical protein
MRAGSTVPRNNTGHSAQHPHSVGDGRTVAGYPHSAGAGFSGGVGGSMWRGFAL